MKKRIIILTVLLLGIGFNTFGQHEYAPLQEQKVRYKDWTYENVRTGEQINLREFTKGKKLVFVFYFAAWCHNSRYQTPFVQKLYEKYWDQGLAIIGVSLYSSVDAVLTELEARNVTFPVVAESQLNSDRESSLHYEYRRKIGDTRKWGTPWNVFLLPENIKKKGDTLVKRIFVANGELIEDEAERFIRAELGLPPEEGLTTVAKDETKVIEVCDENSVDFQKP